MLSFHWEFVRALLQSKEIEGCLAKNAPSLIFTNVKLSGSCLVGWNLRPLENSGQHAPELKRV